VIELYILVEGPTEETFVHSLLYDHLFPMGVWPRPLMTGHRRKSNPSRGGAISCYAALRGDIIKIIRQHEQRGAYVTSMVDLYALPPDVPGFTTRVQTPDPYRRVSAIETAIAADIGYYRFIPYLQLHEFEALLLSDVMMIGRQYPGRQANVQTLADEVAQFDGPEHVDDGVLTAPSKRIATHIQGYDKVIGGSLIAMDIGLELMRHRCPHFSEWLTRIEAIAPEVQQ